MNLSIQNKNKQDIFNIRWWKIFNILSVDVVIGSVSGGILAVRLLHATPGFAWWIVLPLSVWIVYTFDHLIDGIRLKNNSHTVRHFFHYHYSKQIITVIGLMSVINIVLIAFFLEKQILLFGLFAGIITLIYLLIVYISGKKRSFLFQKEFFVALIYTVGIWGGPVALKSYQVSTPELFIIVSFFLTVWAAILILSVYEVEYDRLDKHNTFSINFGINKTVYIIYFMIAVVFFISIGEIIVTPDLQLAMASKILMIMDILLLIILNFPEQLKQNNIYRILVELIFWLPGLFLQF